MIGIVSKETFNSRQGSHSSARDPEWVTVAQNLIRHRDSKIYYLRSKCKGKQLKRSLGTTDRQLANRKLKIALADLAKKSSNISGSCLDHSSDPYLAFLSYYELLEPNPKRQLESKMPMMLSLSNLGTSRSGNCHLKTSTIMQMADFLRFQQVVLTKNAQN